MEHKPTTALIVRVDIDEETNTPEPILEAVEFGVSDGYKDFVIEALKEGFDIFRGDDPGFRFRSGVYYLAEWCHRHEVVNGEHDDIVWIDHMEPATISGVAVIGDCDGILYSLPCPCRHGDVIREAVTMGHPKPVKGLQGFTVDGKIFITRELAWKLVHANALVQTTRCDGVLYSEDLW